MSIICTQLMFTKLNVKNVKRIIHFLQSNYKLCDLYLALLNLLIIIIVKNYFYHINWIL